MREEEMWIQVGFETSAPKVSHCWEQPREFCAIRGAIKHAPRPSSPCSSEAKLVKDSLHALQGLPSAITALRSLAAAFALQAADKTAHNIATLWRLSSSASALAKLLSCFARAGWHRYQLDRFVDFFLGFHRRKAGGACPLLNQAFASAVRTILHAHSAALNLRFDRSSAQSLVELYLHTEELRVQLQALTRICSIGGDGEDEKAAFSTTGNDMLEKFKAFPKGADLLTLLYNLLLEPDPVHLEVLRFLFARTYEPYALFVRSCIYCADLKDPHGEFILEQASRPRRSQPVENSMKSSLKIRTGVNTPVFLVDVSSQMLRTAQQLEVLLKLPETREFAQALSSAFQGSMPSHETDMEGQVSCFLSVAFDKKGLRQVFKQRQHRAETIAEHYRKFFGDKYPTKLEEESATASEDSESEPEITTTDETATSAEVDSLRLGEDSNDNHDSDTGASSEQETVSCDESFLQPHTQDSLFASEVPPESGSSADRALSISSLLTTPNAGLPRNPFYACGEGNINEYISTIFTNTADGWDIRSTLVNENSLAKKLIPELSQVGLLSLTKATKIDIDVASILLKDDNLPAIRRAPESVEERVKLQPAETSSPDEVRSEKSSSPQGGGSWVSALKMTTQHKTTLPGCRQERAGSDIPISVAVEKSITDEILMQYRLVSVFTVRLLQDHLHLQDHYLALRRYYFMEVGDWADNFITALCSHKWGLSRRQHHIVEVQGMLETALQKSSCDGDSYAERLHICSISEGQDDAFVNHNSLEAYDFIELGYHVDWPLNLILTADALCLYNLIFRLLLRVRHAVFALGEISSSLQAVERSMRRLRSSEQQTDKLRALQLFRHQIGHFVTAFQCHVHSQLLHVVWGEFLHAIKHEIKDMQDLEVVHHKYLTNAVHQCFLSLEHTGVKLCTDNIMQCLLDFRSSLKNIRSWEDDKVCIDKLYSRVLELRSSFHETVCRLHKYYLKSEAQHQLSDFWMALDYNGYLASTC
ncbi:uncharacterized protein LOC9638353 isoform X1 [Selaginella moellendorffii]|uniref:uncharacterized protein LOC9638353 isoform X1 n=1 Tax=Selaginella moellendorffii TaxID=88036 RepID=UPI000D1C7EB4|nr:uncharacterized protein LOC9638353 isoform X1 [Selaginella moellendorffii]XP_024537725.1 uncharacterized protein LOC9638353 isoform X1 [Selaginella moellendorffii]|eukprot:XP_024537724.1 uncharacterized protein LOC9638353 isoform X1 [Selaginella moellendorffii]